MHIKKSLSNCNYFILYVFKELQRVKKQKIKLMNFQIFSLWYINSFIFDIIKCYYNKYIKNLLRQNKYIFFR